MAVASPVVYSQGGEALNDEQIRLLIETILLVLELFRHFGS